MAIPLERPASGCALHGALHAAAAVRGVVPILHAPAGCGTHAALAGPAAGWAGPGPAGGLAAASTNLCEKQVVFGGTARLREQIKNAVKVMPGQLYVVLGSCPTEMIGDDIAAMAREARAQGFPVLDIAAAGFRGPAQEGYGLFLQGVLARPEVLGPVLPPEPDLVNLLGILPGQDVFWEGDLDEWSRLLAGIGLRANPVFGHAGGVEGLRDLSRASISLVLSPWGAGVARTLEANVGVPWLDIGELPVGAEATCAALRALAARLGRDGAVDAFVEAEVRRETYFLTRLAEAYHRHGLQREFAMVASGAQAAGLVTFLVATLGWLPRTVVVTETLPEAARAKLAEGLGKLLDDFGAALLFSENASAIAEAIEQRGAEIVLGRAIEGDVAARLGVPLVELAFPVTDRLVLDRPCSGARGAIALVEAIGETILAASVRREHPDQAAVVTSGCRP
jgi:nitrogenase molybdenum-iron protein beta chain